MQPSSFQRIYMLKAHVFPSCNIWLESFNFVLSVLLKHVVCMSQLYSQYFTSNRLWRRCRCWRWLQLLSYINKVKTIYIFKVSLYWLTSVTWCKYLKMVMWPWPHFQCHLDVFFDYIYLILTTLLRSPPWLTLLHTYIYIHVYCVNRL